MDLIHYYKRKKQTNNIDSKIVQTNSGLYRIAANCSTLKHKNKFIMKPEDVIKPTIKQKLNKK